MNWPDERYVRLYTRDTAEWLCWPWEARAVFPLLLRKLDRSGVLATNLGPRGVAVLISIPENVVSVGLSALISDGCLAKHELGYVVPRFLEAQECAMSDAARQRESRDKRRLGVTFRDQMSRTVTNGHAASHPVTPSLAVPSVLSRTEDQNKNPPSPPSGGTPKPRGKAVLTADERELAAKVLQRLSERSGIKYRGSDAHLTIIAQRLRDGFTERDLRCVIWHCANKWASDEKMAQYLRPETLFGPRTIEKYIDAARTEYSKVETAEASKKPQGEYDGEQWTQPDWMTSIGGSK